MKTNKYVMMGLLASITLASCSNDETEVASAGTDVRISAGLADAETKAVINSGYDEKLDVVFGYVEGSGSSYTSWYNGVRMAGEGNQFVSFEEILKYSQSTDVKTRMVGVYPRPANASVSNPIAYTIDGDMDLMVTEGQTADKENPFQPFMFNHQLTQLQVKCVGSEDAIKAWGNIRSVKVANQPVNLSLSLVPGTPHSLSVNGNGSLESLSFHNYPTKIVTAKEENPQIGYCMIYPQNNMGMSENPIELEILTDYDGTNASSPRPLNSPKKIKVENIAKGARRGYAHLITLVFTVDKEITVEADIAPWRPGNGTSTVIKPS